MSTQIYLDNSTTTKPSEKAVSAMMPFWTTYWGTPSAAHQKGQELHAALAQNFKMLYRCLGADEEDQLVLTSCGAEAVNHVISSTYRDVTLPSGKNQFLVSQNDEAASIMSMNRLEPLGCVIKQVEVNSQGIVSHQALIDRISPRTSLLSLSWANGLTGVIQPLHEISEICSRRGIRLHLDATHVIGKLYYDLKETGADFITFNTEQLHAPKGSGLLWIKKGISCSPYICGSADQSGMRAGGMNMPALAALAKAFEEAIESQDYLCTEIARLKSLFESHITEQLPNSLVCFKKQERLPHCTTIIFPGLCNEALFFALNRKGLFASIGGGSFQQLTRLLKATGIDNQLCQSAVSFSLSRYTTENEIENAAAIVVNTVQSMQKLILPSSS